MSSLASKKVYDCVVIGKGPCGISLAVYLKRFNYEVIVIGKDNGALGMSKAIDNYYGFESISGNDLIEKGINQAKNLGIEVIDDEVISIEDKTVICRNSSYEGKTIFLALGKARESLRAKNLKKFEGNGISYCAICDGFFFRKKKIGIVGSGEYMKSELNILKRFTSDIIIFTNGEEVEGVEEEVCKEKIVSFYGEENLEGVETENNKYDLDGLFMAIGSLSSFTLAKHLGLAMDELNNLIVDNYHCNIPGFFAGGDCIGGLHQVVKAASDGALASMEIKKYLESLK